MLKFSRVATFMMASGGLLGLSQTAEAVCFGGAPNGTIEFTDPQTNTKEACDDGNTVANDGCTSQCTIEQGFSCKLAFMGTSFRNEDFGPANSSTKPVWTHHADGMGSTQATNTAQPSVGLFDIQALDLGADTPYVFDISTSTSDDDYIGFVIGFNPGDGTTAANNPNYLIFDWKGQNQTFTNPTWTSYAGYRLQWIQGVPDNTKEQELHEFWKGNIGASKVVWSNLNSAGDTLASRSWTGNKRYRFYVTYTTTTLKIEVERYANASATTPEEARHTILDVTPSVLNGYTASTFPAGQLGLYTLSQPNTSFKFVGPRGSVCDTVCNDGFLVPGIEECDGTPGCNQNTCRFSVDIHDQAAGSPDLFPGTISFTGTASPGAVVTMSVNGPNGAISIPAANRDVIAAADGTFTWTSTVLTDIGTHTINASATDVASGVTTDSTTRDIVDPLILVDDSLSVVRGTLGTVNTRTNDFAHANTPISVTRIASSTVPGSYAIGNDGVFEFTANASTPANLTVDYEVCVTLASGNYCKDAQIAITVIEATTFDAESVWQRVGVASASLDLSTVFNGAGPLDLTSIVFPAVSTGGTPTSPGDGTIVFTPDDAAIPGTYVVDYRACAATTPAACADGKVTFYWNDDPAIQSGAVSVAPESVTTHTVSILPQVLGSIESTSVSGTGCALNGSTLTFTAPATIPAGGTVSCTITAVENLPSGNKPTSTGVWVFTVTNDFVAADDAFETYENTELSIAASDLLVNDANASPGSLAIVGTPDDEGAYATAEGGTLTPNTAGDGWIYAPPADFLGEDSFEYTVCSVRDLNVCERVEVIIDIVASPAVEAATTWVVVGTPSVEFDLSDTYAGQYPLDFATIAQTTAVAGVSSAILSSVITITPDDIDAPGVYEVEFDYCDTNSPAGCQSVVLTTVYNDHPTVSDITYTMKPNATHTVALAVLFDDRDQGQVEGGWDDTSIVVGPSAGGPFGSTAMTPAGTTCTIVGSNFTVTTVAEESTSDCYVRFCESNPGPAGTDAANRACTVQKISVVVDEETVDPGPEPNPVDPGLDEGYSLSGGRVWGACSQSGSSAMLVMSLLALGALALRNRRRAA